MHIEQEISANFTFKSNFIEVNGSKIHYVDEGTGDPVLFLHGNPTSSYLWRNIIPYLSSHTRCIAPDLVGFGKSDKPKIDYGFFDHVNYLEAFIEMMNLKNITLVLHNWGSALGFHYAMRNEHNIKGIAFMEAILMPIKSWEMFPVSAREIFQGFRTPQVGWDMIVNNNIFIEQVLPLGVFRDLTDEEMNYYREPFKDPITRRPIWRWPNEIPIQGEPSYMVEVVETYKNKLKDSELPKLLFFDNPGFFIDQHMVHWCKSSLKNIQVVDIGPGSHFLQEDNPHLIGSELAQWSKNLN